VDVVDGGDRLMLVAGLTIADAASAEPTAPGPA
jgi:hypothetical protein